MSPPSIILVPGSFALPRLYDPTVNAVTATGIEIQALHYPSVGVDSGLGRDGDPPTMYDDAAFVASEVEKLADQGRDVVLVGHSYGGIPITECTKGLTKAERKRDGKEGGIVRLAYITALVPAVGGSAATCLAGVPPELQLELKVDEKGWMYHDDFAATAAIAFSELPKDEGVAWAKKFARHSAASFGSELTHPGYKDVPVSFLFCEDDRCVVPQVQSDEIEMIERESGRKVDVTRIAADHCPNLGHLDEVVDWLVGLTKLG